MSVTALPLILSHKLWEDVWLGVRSRAWDGTGHYAIAQVYSQSIFPNIFGWTHAYFGGMPFPNFYPPIFYWLVALLHHTQLLTFSSAFKLVVVLPVLLMPAAMWLLGWAVSGKSHLAAAGTALASLPLLVDSRFLLGFPSGLDYFSTFQIGLYTQPLGFVLLILWYVSYLKSHRRRWLFALSCLLLALTALANFFNAVTTAVMIAAVLFNDIVRYRGSDDSDQKVAARSTLLKHALVPLIAACLASFWLVPMLGQYEYFVTRPYVIEISKLVTPALWGYYAVALAGSIVWLRQPSADAKPYVTACALLAACLLFAATLAPGWFPLQSSRFLTTLNFLLSVPAGQALAAAFHVLAKLLGEAPRGNQVLSLRKARYTTGASLFVLLLLALTSPGPRWAYAFYPEGGKDDVDDVLNFGREHRDGRFLVEMIEPSRTGISFDARAINAYLGAQGNEMLSAVFHEASPSALFTLPLINAFSDYPDSFGISSALADDLDFATQPLSRHIERARLLGVKYLVLRSPVKKDLIAREPAVAARHDFGNWSVFELWGEPEPRARLLPYKPALVVSSFTLKQRRRNELSFIRLAEEQFADGWFDVLLARSPESRIDRLRGLELFGALVVDEYDFDDEGRAYEVLKGFAQDRTLILLSSDSTLFRRIRDSRADFPRLVMVARAPEEPGEVLEAMKPSYHYQGSAIRQQWGAIRRALENNKMPLDVEGLQIKSELDHNTITVNVPDTPQQRDVPLLVSTTFHPRWRRSGGESVYAATPFYMLTFASRPVELTYGRDWHEHLALYISASTFVLLALFVALNWRSSHRAAKELKLSVK